MPSLFWGFRLTIWNVNCFLLSVTSSFVSSFRLTIWNVNNIVIYDQTGRIIVLD
ncbi:hypothetical protein C673_2824 [Clostridioides difficile F200]|nr:hypothetical protein QGM_0987 [Clostridioides difficile CD211]EQK55596.1 hypothetical protein C673_2824 [Clostridioides difficile F200]HAT4369178.1 hypothetical protein [Clostridioides difficile]